MQPGERRRDGRRRRSLPRRMITFLHERRLPVKMMTLKTTIRRSWGAYLFQPRGRATGRKSNNPLMTTDFWEPTRRYDVSFAGSARSRLCVAVLNSPRNFPRLTSPSSLPLMRMNTAQQEIRRPPRSPHSSKNDSYCSRVTPSNRSPRRLSARSSKNSWKSKRNNKREE